METIRGAEHAIVSRLDALKDYEHEVNLELNSLASGHAERSRGMLDLLAIDTELHPAQRLTQAWHDSTPEPLDKIVETAYMAEKNFPHMVQKLLDAEQITNSLSHLGEDLMSGQNVIIVTNHGEIKDIAVTLAAYYASIKHTGIKQDRSYNFSTNILVSKIIPHLGFYGMPAVDVLGMMCDRQYFSFPKTDSIKKTKIAPYVVNTYNAALRSAIKVRLKQGGNLFAIAPSGTVDKPLNDESSILGLAPVGRGTAKILHQANTKILPVAFWSQDDQVVFEPLDIPRHLRDKEDIHTMMDGISHALTEAVPKKNFLYLKRKD